MSTYYVDPSSGSDSNNGTSQNTPWAHIPGAPAWSGTYHAAAGDIIYIKGGASFTPGGSIQFSYSGTSGSPITIARSTTWGSGAVTFTGGSEPTYYGTFEFDYNNYVVLDGATAGGFIINNPAHAGIMSNYSNGLQVKNLLVNKPGDAGVRFQGCNNFFIYDVEVYGGWISNNGGIYIGGGTNFNCTQGIVQNCNVHEIGYGPAGAQAGGTDMNIGFWNTNSKNIAYINCQAYNITGRGFDTGAVDEPPEHFADNILFLNCQAWNTFAAFGNSSDGYYTSDAAGNTKCRQYYVNCISHHNICDGAWLYAGATGYYYNCVFALNAGCGFFTDTCVESTPSVAQTIGYFANCIFYNNLGGSGNGNCDIEIGNPSTEPGGKPQYLGDYNLFDRGNGTEAMIYYNWIAPIASGSSPEYYYYQTSGSNLTAWYQNHGQDKHSGDSSSKGWHALFNNAPNYDFTLQTGSSARGNGVNLLGNPLGFPDDVFAIMQSVWGISPVDFAGNARPALGTPWDIGAYQYGSAAGGGGTGGGGGGGAGTPLSIQVVDGLMHNDPNLLITEVWGYVPIYLFVNVRDGLTGGEGIRWGLALNIGTPALGPAPVLTPQPINISTYVGPMFPPWTPPDPRRIMVPDTQIHIYSDVNLNFVESENTFVYDQEAVWQSMTCLLNTRLGERLFNPMVSLDLETFLGEDIDVEVAMRMFAMIMDGVPLFEPRFVLQTRSCNVIPDNTNHGYLLLLIGYIKAFSNQTFTYQGFVTPAIPPTIL